MAYNDLAPVVVAVVVPGAGLVGPCALAMVGWSIPPQNGSTMRATPNDHALLDALSGFTMHPRNVREALDAGANPNVRATRVQHGLGFRPLHTLLQHHDDPGMVALLIERGANVNIALNDGPTPLHIAAKHGRIGSAKALIAAGAALNAPTSKDAQTPLAWALLHNKNAMAEVLAEYGATLHDEGYPHPLHHAVRQLKPSTVACCLRMGMSPNALELRSSPLNRSTPLGAVVEANQFSWAPSGRGTHAATDVVDVVDLLLAAGADVHARPCSFGEQTALSYAIDNINIPEVVLERLFKAGSSPYGQPMDRPAPDMGMLVNRTASLHKLAKRGEHPRLSTLIGWGVDVNARDANGNTLLHAALNPDGFYRQHTGKTQSMHVTVDLLLRSGADVNATNTKGETVLGLALLNSADVRMATVQQLLAQGADPCAMTTVARHAKPDVTDVVPLILAARPERFQWDFQQSLDDRATILKGLLDHGADPACPLPNGVPLVVDHADHPRHQDVFELLASYVTNPTLLGPGVLLSMIKDTEVDVLKRANALLPLMFKMGVSAASIVGSYTTVNQNTLSEDEIQRLEDLQTNSIVERMLLEDESQRRMDPTVAPRVRARL